MDGADKGPKSYPLIQFQETLTRMTASNSHFLLSDLDMKQACGCKDGTCCVPGVPRDPCVQFYSPRLAVGRVAVSGPSMGIERGGSDCGSQSC